MSDDEEPSVPDLRTAEPAVDVLAAAQPIRALVRRSMLAVEQHDSLRDVARELIAADTDAAIVRGPVGEVGIVTERDVVVVAASGGDLDREQVRSVMSADLLTAAADEPIAAVGRSMVGAGVRHVVVCDGARVVGVVSAADVLDALLA